MGERCLCYGCMQFKHEEEHVCPSCGYDDRTPNDPAYITPGTILNGHFAVGIRIGSNSEGATYIGYNQSIGCRVLIREYFPRQLCSRVPGKAIISVDPKHVVQYKALMAEFTELNRSLAQMRGSVNHINPTSDLFATNNTTYAVYEYLEGVTLVDYLKDNAGELTWKQVSEVFPPFFTSLSQIHNNAIIHRAISPETIYVTQKGELRLSGFSVSAVRTVHSELEPEIFHGYAAPEQYSPNQKQGTWTDVYGICAVLYRILTGCKPTDAPSRMENDNLCAPHEMNPSIPKHVSRVIMKGMSLYSDDRIKTVTELVTALFREEPDPATGKFPAQRRAEDDTQRREPNGEHRRPRNNGNSNNKNNGGSGYRDYDQKGYGSDAHENVIDRIKVPVIIAVLLACVLMVIAIIVLQLLDMGPTTLGTPTIETTLPQEMTSVSDNIVTESDSGTEVTDAPSGDSSMPDLVGKNFETKKAQLESDGWLYLVPVYAYSDKYKAGVITDQSIAAGTPFTTGAVVEVTVSKGPQSIKLPEYEGKTLKEYEAILESMGMTNYNTVSVENQDMKNGMVVELSKEAGEEFDLTGSETLKIYYVANPEATPVPLQTTAPPAPIETAPTTEEQTAPPLELETDPPAVVDEPVEEMTAPPAPVIPE